MNLCGGRSIDRRAGGSVDFLQQEELTEDLRRSGPTLSSLRQNESFES